MTTPRPSPSTGGRSPSASRPSAATIPRWRWPLPGLGGIYLSQDEDVPAEAFLVRALAIQEQVLPPEHEDLGQTLRILGYLYERQGKSAEAQAFAARADAILGETPF
jgi:hypothetical protein